MGWDPQENFDDAWIGARPSLVEHAAQLAVCAAIGVPLLAAYETVQLVRRVRAWLRPAPASMEGARITRDDIERIMGPRRRAAARRN